VVSLCSGGCYLLFGAYSFFDALQGWQCKLSEANSTPAVIGQELEQGLAGGGRSSTWAGILSLIPGLGHMYLGQLDKGLGIMAGFS